MYVDQELAYCYQSGSVEFVLLKWIVPACTVHLLIQESRKGISPYFCWACANSLLSCPWPTELDRGRQKSPPTSCSAGGSSGGWQRSLPWTTGDIHKLLTSIILRANCTSPTPWYYPVKGILQVCFLVTWIIQTFIWERLWCNFTVYFCTHSLCSGVVTVLGMVNL